MWMLAALLISVLNYSAVGLNADVTINLIHEFITENRPKAAVAMTCWKTAGNCCLCSRFIVRILIQIVQSEGRHVTEQQNNKHKVNGQTQDTYSLRSYEREMNNAVPLSGNCTSYNEHFLKRGTSVRASLYRMIKKSLCT
jgi:hypothetical protein